MADPIELVTVENGQGLTESSRYVVSIAQLHSIPRSDLNLPPDLCDGFWTLNTHNQRLITPSDSLFFSYFPVCVGPICTPIVRRDILRLIGSFTFHILIAQIVAYVLLILKTEDPLNGLSIDSSLLIKYGAMYPSAILVKGEYWRFLSTILLHGSALHLLVNGLLEVVFVLGREAMWNRFRMGLILVLSSLCGSLFTIAFNRDSAAVGASCGIFGVFGAFISMYFVIFDILPWRHRIGVIIMFSTIVLLLLFAGNQQQIDNLGHVGGFIFGLGIGSALFAHRSSSKRRTTFFYVFGVPCSALALGCPLVYIMLTNKAATSSAVSLSILY